MKSFLVLLVSLSLSLPSFAQPEDCETQLIQKRVITGPSAKEIYQFYDAYFSEIGRPQDMIGGGNNETSQVTYSYDLEDGTSYVKTVINSARVEKTEYVVDLSQTSDYKIASMIKKLRLGADYIPLSPISKDNLIFKLEDHLNPVKPAPLPQEDIDNKPLWESFVDLLFW